MWTASRRPQTTAPASRRYRRAGWPWPIELSRLTRATTAMPTPQALSTTLCLPAFSATANVTAIITSSAVAVLSSVTANGPAGMPLTPPDAAASRRRGSYPGQGELADADVSGPEAGFGVGQVEGPHPGEHVVEAEGVQLGGARGEPVR